jgi:hypothetical protein
VVVCFQCTIEIKSVLNAIFLEKSFKKFKVGGISGNRPTSKSTVCQDSAIPDGGWEGNEA